MGERERRVGCARAAGGLRASGGRAARASARLWQAAPQRFPAARARARGSTCLTAGEEREGSGGWRCESVSRGPSRWKEGEMFTR